MGLSKASLQHVWESNDLLAEHLNRLLQLGSIEEFTVNQESKESPSSPNELNQDPNEETKQRPQDQSQKLSELNDTLIETNQAQLKGNERQKKKKCTSYSLNIVLSKHVAETKFKYCDLQLMINLCSFYESDLLADVFDCNIVSLVTVDTLKRGHLDQKQSNR